MGVTRGAFWFWVVGAMLTVLAGCGVVEGLRQSAFVEQARAEQQQQRAQEITAILGACQDATQLVAAAAKDSPEVMAVVTQLQRGHAMAVERAVSIEVAAGKSEIWQTADAAVVGPPKTPVSADTPDEDTARTDFTARARTISNLRAGASAMGIALGDLRRPGLSNPSASDSTGTSLVYGGGILATLLGGVGMAGLLKKLRSIGTAVGQLSTSESTTQQMSALKDEMSRRQADTEAMVKTLQNATDQLREMLATSASAQTAKA